MFTYAVKTKSLPRHAYIPIGAMVIPLLNSTDTNTLPWNLDSRRFSKNVYYIKNICNVPLFYSKGNHEPDYVFIKIHNHDTYYGFFVHVGNIKADYVY